jgi:hypothetical protein
MRNFSIGSAMLENPTASPTDRRVGTLCAFHLAVNRVASLAGGADRSKTRQ